MTPNPTQAHASPSTHVVFVVQLSVGLVPEWPWRVIPVINGSTATVWECHQYLMIESTDLMLLGFVRRVTLPITQLLCRDSYISETSNPFDPLSNLSSTLDPEVAPNSSNLSRLESCSSEASESDFGSPIKRSSPIKRPNRRKNTSRPLKILSVNLQSLNAKKRRFGKPLTPLNLTLFLLTRPG